MPKLRLFPYNKKFAAIFQKQREKLIKLLGNQEIHHIGSTAVPGLGGKGIIDIMIALKDWKDGKGAIEKLKTIGFTHIHPKDKGRIFISQPGETKYGGIHIHLVKKGGKEYRNLLFFRDYLREHKKEAKEYDFQKMQLLNKAKGNRAIYKKLKVGYIKNILKHAKH
jgi:GrpB-like predicted nucleotidyltransferase (UPF0157 family)